MRPTAAFNICPGLTSVAFVRNGGGRWAGLNCREGNLDASKLHEVVLVGGCARIPRLQTAFKDALGKSPTIAKERDSAARGAAVQVLFNRVLPFGRVTRKCILRKAPITRLSGRVRAEFAARHQQCMSG